MTARIRWDWAQKVRKAHQFRAIAAKLDPTPAQLQQAAIDAQRDKQFQSVIRGPKEPLSIRAKQTLSVANRNRPVTLAKVSCMGDAP